MEQGLHYSASLMVWSRLFPLSHSVCVCVTGIYSYPYFHMAWLLIRYRDFTVCTVFTASFAYSIRQKVKFFFAEKLNLMPQRNIQNNNICDILYNWKLRPNMQKQSLLPLIIGSNLCMPQGKESQIMNWYCGELRDCTARAVLVVNMHKIQLYINEWVESRDWKCFCFSLGLCGIISIFFSPVMTVNSVNGAQWWVKRADGSLYE